MLALALTTAPLRKAHPPIITYFPSLCIWGLHTFIHYRSMANSTFYRLCKQQFPFNPTLQTCFCFSKNKI